MDNEMKIRWRLILGEVFEGAENGLENPQERQQEMNGQLLDEKQIRIDNAMDFLYSREYSQDRNIRSGGNDSSELTVPTWINLIHELFPKSVVERLERDAIERYQIQEIVTDVDLLRRSEPSMTLLKAIMHTKNLMDKEVLEEAKKLVKKVVEELVQKMKRKVDGAFHRTPNRHKRSYLKINKNFDIKRTIRKNLKNYDTESGKLIIETPLFFSRSHSKIDRWKLIILVDQSASMLESVIHSAVTASVFWGIDSIQVRLIAFDTNIVDLTEYCTDPIETLMKVQLGGGTDIGAALRYAEGLMDDPKRSIILLISDFYEGGSASELYAAVHRIMESGAKLLGLAALDEEANPNYDRTVASKFVELGASVAAMTPGELAEWIGEIIN